MILISHYMKLILIFKRLLRRTRINALHPLSTPLPKTTGRLQLNLSVRFTRTKFITVLDFRKAPGKKWAHRL